MIPFAHGRRLFEAAAPPKAFVALEGGHGDAFEVDSAAYFGAIGRFVAETLAVRHGGRRGRGAVWSERGLVGIETGGVLAALQG